MTLAEIVVIAIPVVSAITSVLAALSQRRKTGVETKSLEDEITDRVLKRAQVAIDDLQNQVNDLRAELAIYRTWSSMLCNQLNEHGVIPVPMPERKR